MGIEYIYYSRTLDFQHKSLGIKTSAIKEKVQTPRSLSVLAYIYKKMGEVGDQTERETA